MSVLSVEGLTLAAGDTILVRDVSFDVKLNETLGLVGESGSGKTMTALAIMGFLPRAVQIVGGHVHFDGQDLLSLSQRQRAQYLGDMTMIFQEPRAALNPLMPAGDQVARSIRLHTTADRRKADQAAVELLRRVGIRDPDRVARAYPHQLSGGMCQRVLIAMMLECRPKLLIADEPTTALDVTVQAQIFDLLDSVREETGASVLLITHDLGVVAQTCDRAAVMYGGQIMEISDVQTLFKKRIHPYTRYLIDSLEPTAEEHKAEAVDYSIKGCRFAHRCPESNERCWLQRPTALRLGQDTVVYCLRREEDCAAGSSRPSQIL